MLTAFDDDLKVIYADMARKKDDRGINISYKCKSCDAEMILKKGKVKIHHFAHKAKDNCIERGREGKEHREMKYHLRDLFGGNIEMEKIILDGDTRHIADVVYNNVVFEVQFSHMSFDEFKERTLGFSKNGYKVVWIFHKKRYGQIYDTKYKYWKLKILLFFMYCWEIPIFIYDGDKDKIIKYDIIQFVNGKNGQKYRNSLDTYILGIKKSEVLKWNEREIYSADELIEMAIMGSSTDEFGDEISIKSKFRKNDRIHRALNPRIDEKSAIVNHWFYICDKHHYPNYDSFCAKCDYDDDDDW